MYNGQQSSPWRWVRVVDEALALRREVECSDPEWLRLAPRELRDRGQLNSTLTVVAGEGHGVVAEAGTVAGVLHNFSSVPVPAPRTVPMRERDNECFRKRNV